MQAGVDSVVVAVVGEVAKSSNFPPPSPRARQKNHPLRRTIKIKIKIKVKSMSLLL